MRSQLNSANVKNLAETEQIQTLEVGGKVDLDLDLNRGLDPDNQEG